MRGAFLSHSGAADLDQHGLADMLIGGLPDIGSVHFTHRHHLSIDGQFEDAGFEAFFAKGRVEFFPAHKSMYDKREGTYAKFETQCGCDDGGNMAAFLPRSAQEIGGHLDEPLGFAQEHAEDGGQTLEGGAIEVDAGKVAHEIGDESIIHGVVGA